MPPVGSHEWVAEYNWDDGLAPIWVIADSPATEFATALLIYWRLDGPWLEAAAAGPGAEAYRLQTIVRERLLAGFYPVGQAKFDPKDELSRTQIYKLRTTGLPELLLGQATQELD